MAYAAADTSRFYIDGTGLIDFYEKFKYLGSMLHYSLTSVPLMQMWTSE